MLKAAPMPIAKAPSNTITTPIAKSNTAYTQFIYAISNAETLDYYRKRLKIFLDFVNCPCDTFEVKLMLYTP